MDNPETLATLSTQDTWRRQQQKKEKKKRNLIKNRASTQVLTKGKQFQLVIGHPSCYSYSIIYKDETIDSVLYNKVNLTTNVSVSCFW